RNNAGAGSAVSCLIARRRRLEQNLAAFRHRFDRFLDLAFERGVFSIDAAIDYGDAHAASRAPLPKRVRQDASPQVIIQVSRIKGSFRLRHVWNLLMLRFRIPDLSARVTTAAAGSM